MRKEDSASFWEKEAKTFAPLSSSLALPRPAPCAEDQDRREAGEQQ
jgi:hypothetical protein